MSFFVVISCSGNRSGIPMTLGFIGKFYLVGVTVEGSLAP